MDITFENPGIEYMLKRILAFQTDDESSFWSEPLYRFYPQLNKSYAKSLRFEERKAYIAQTMRIVYSECEDVINEKTLSYSEHWIRHRNQITEAFSDVFDLDCSSLFNDVRCNITLNPIEPRFLKERYFDIFYLNSERGAIGVSLHELIHIVWFYVWNKLFQDSYEEYERPSLKWILSEMVVESIMRDSRLSSINPYFPRENGGCIYPYFFDMKVDGTLILDTIDKLHGGNSIEDFMKKSYAFCLDHEEEIRAHIAKSEQS